MTRSAKPRMMIVLRQVEGPRWCVIQHAVENGKRSFVSRIATAREYADAVRIAAVTAAKMRLPLTIEANGKALRRFDHRQDAPRSTSPRAGDFCEPYDRGNGR